MQHWSAGCDTDIDCWHATKEGDQICQRLFSQYSFTPLIGQQIIYTALIKQHCIFVI